MLTRILAATAAGGITFFVSGFIIYGLLLDERVMKPNMNFYQGLVKEIPNFIPLVLANFVSAFLLAWIFEKWAGIRSFMGGLQGGAIVWFLTALSFQLMFLAFMNLSKNYIPVVADIIGSAVMGAIGGGVIGQVLGMMNKQPAATE